MGKQIVDLQTFEIRDDKEVGKQELVRELVLPCHDKLTG